jgi:hypothetical protein
MDVFGAIGPSRFDPGGGEPVVPLSAAGHPATSSEVIAAIGRRDPGAPARVTHAPTPDPALQAQFGAWPRAGDFARARALGLRGDTDLDALLDDALGACGP